MACGKYPVPSKTCLKNKILERVDDVSYLGYNLSYHEETDVNKIIKYSKSWELSTGLWNLPWNRKAQEYALMKPWHDSYTIMLVLISWGHSVDIKFSLSFFPKSSCRNCDR